MDRHWMGGIRKRVQQARWTKETRERALHQQKLKENPVKNHIVVTSKSQDNSMSQDLLMLNEPENVTFRKIKRQKTSLDQFSSQKKQHLEQHSNNISEIKSKQEKPKIEFIDEGINKTGEVYKLIEEEFEKDALNNC